MRFGKLPPLIDYRTLRFGNYLTAALTPPPASYDVLPQVYGKLGTNDPKVLFPMDGNDYWGCHSADTEVLTETGWQQWPEYDGANLGTINQITQELEFQAPLALQRYEYNGPMYFGIGKRVNFGLTPEHRMLCRPYRIPKPYVPGTAGYGASRFIRMDNLPKHVSLPAAPSGFLGAHIEALTIGERTWPGDDFVAMLGAIVSDGYASGVDTAIPQRISFCCFDERQQEVRAMAARLAIREQKNRTGVWTFYDQALANWIRANCYDGQMGSAHKRVPDLIKSLNCDQIWKFIEFFGDQTKHEEWWQFYSSSKGLIDDLQELILRVGLRGLVYKREARNSHTSFGKVFVSNHPSWSLHISKKKHVTLQQVKRSPCYEIDKYHGEVFCATVPNSTLITRREGVPLISGNCCVIAAIAHGDTIYHGLIGKRSIMSSWECTKLYFSLTHGQDIGLNELSTINYWRRTAIGGDKILAYASINPHNHTHVMQAIQMFGGIMIGFQVQQACISDFNARRPWTPGPLINAGHAVWVTQYDATGITCLAWGNTQRGTWAWWDETVDEAWAILAPEAATPGFAPGFNFQQLQTDLGLVAN